METLHQAIEAATLQAHNIPETSRVLLLNAATKLVSALQTPEDAIYRVAYSPMQFMAMRTLHSLGVFKQIVEKESVTSTELSETTAADKVLLERLLRVMIAAGVVVESGISTYSPNAQTRSVSERKMGGMVEAIFDGQTKPMAGLPEYLEKTGYKNPLDPQDGPFQYGHNAPGESFFEFLSKRPKIMNSYSTFFEASRGSRPDWIDWFPVQEKLLDDASKPVTKDDILLIDVAGNRGHDLMAFKNKFSSKYPGRYVLFDQPHIIEDQTLDLGEDVEKKAFDFFKDPVLPDARLYYMKFILHDWDDDNCLTILNNVTSVMKKGFSNLIIEDFIIPMTGCKWMPAMFDLQMMISCASMERNEAQWMHLLDAAGLEIEGFYPPPGDGTGIIVTKLKE
ncbi:O-methyltransferase [Periconia macrospinosa]|uniref:O-methyltransferase n=1 Tax=Periconia macrospinosa TaxID=97972 RepID=A0A2V1E4R8_9PLEO|nr:O-methyltransferase [Periconia macrospinosa]